MPIIKSQPGQNKAIVDFHVVQRIEIAMNAPEQNAIIMVQSWVSEEDYVLNSGLNAVDTHYLGLPLAALSGGPIKEVAEQYLVTDGGSPFLGGSLVPFMTDTDGVRLRRWANIKQSRQIITNGGMEWSGMVFQTDPDSTRSITVRAGKALAQKLAGLPEDTEWTLKDNSRVTLTADQVIALNAALSDFIDRQHEISQALRAKLDLATTSEQVQAVVWPFTQAAVQELLAPPTPAPQP